LEFERENGAASRAEVWNMKMSTRPSRTNCLVKKREHKKKKPSANVRTRNMLEAKTNLASFSWSELISDQGYIYY